MEHKVTSSPAQHPEPKITAMTWVRVILIIAVLPAVILFGSAGTWNWPMAWLYLLLSTLSFIISRLIVWRIHPDLLAERGRMLDHKDTAPFDRVLAPLLAFIGPVLIWLVAGFALRFNWLPMFSTAVEWVGVTLFVVGFIFGSWALVVNRYFSGVVRIQNERRHQVVTTGPYTLVRHPGYLGAIVSYLGMVLMLGSPWALIPFLFQQAVLVIRTHLEDKYLQQNLPGYKAYAHKTCYRLIPGLW